MSFDDIRKEELSIRNRCLSILEDSKFVNYVAKQISFPVVSNKRGGDWYVDPAIKSSESYFKSTDGHQNQVSFSLKRLNLHIAELAISNGGVTVVDTTRRGKRMPDSFSKTVPVWCAVLNKAILDVDLLVLRPDQVSKSEYDVIQSKISYWASQLKEIVPLTELPKLKYPLRPLWFVNGDFIPELDNVDGFLAVILVTASKPCLDRSHGFSYIQGAADDHELWAPPQLTASTYWLPEARKLREGKALDFKVDIKNVESRPMEVKLSETILLVYADLRHEISVTKGAPSSGISGYNGKETIDLRHLGTGKKSSRAFASFLPEIDHQLKSNAAEIVIYCLPNSDLGLSCAIAYTCMHAGTYASKTEVLKIAAPLISAAGYAPSRASYNVVGAYLRNS